jgi:hypothetical protein
MIRRPGSAPVHSPVQPVRVVSKPTPTPDELHAALQGASSVRALRATWATVVTLASRGVLSPGLTNMLRVVYEVRLFQLGTVDKLPDGTPDPAQQAEGLLEFAAEQIPDLYAHLAGAVQLRDLVALTFGGDSRWALTLYTPGNWPRFSGTETEAKLAAPLAVGLARVLFLFAMPTGLLALVADVRPPQTPQTPQGDA